RWSTRRADAPALLGGLADLDRIGLLHALLGAALGVVLEPLRFLADVLQALLRLHVRLGGERVGALERVVRQPADDQRAAEQGDEPSHVVNLLRGARACGRAASTTAA